MPHQKKCLQDQLYLDQSLAGTYMALTRIDSDQDSLNNFLGPSYQNVDEISDIKVFTIFNLKK